jgi:acyl-CoA thioesterase FadM
MSDANTPIRTDELDPVMLSRGFISVFGLLKLADELCDNVFTQIGLGQSRAIATGETVFTAAAHVNNFQPIEGPQTFYGRVAVSELGTKKFVTKTYFSADTGEAFAEVETVHVCYDLKKRRSMQIPEDIVNKIRLLLK